MGAGGKFVSAVIVCQSALHAEPFMYAKYLFVIDI